MHLALGTWHLARKDSRRMPTRESCLADTAQGLDAKCQVPSAFQFRRRSRSHPEQGYILLTLMFLATALGLVGLAGYWLMRRWGVYVYSAAAVLMIVAVLAGAGPLVVAVRMAVVAGFGWFFIRTMV